MHAPFPRELFIVFAVAAPVVEYLFRPADCTGLELVRATIASALACVTLPAVIYAMYRWVVPRMLPPALRPIRVIAVHVPLVGALAGASALAMVPVVGAIHTRTGSDPTRFAVIAAIVAAATLVPAMLLTELRRARDEAANRARQERQARLEAELAALQARTSPHFLFNTLNTVASLIHEDPDLAEATLERLAAVFRHALEGSRAASVPIDRELAVCEDYLEIQAARFGDRFTWRVAIDPRARGLSVPPMLIQPLVENAVVHGVARRRSGGTVEIAVEVAADTIVCTVTDNGASSDGPLHPGGGGTGTSLIDLRARLELVPGSALATEQVASGGFRASLVIPVVRAP